MLLKNSNLDLSLERRQARGHAFCFRRLWQWHSSGSATQRRVCLSQSLSDYCRGSLFMEPSPMAGASWFSCDSLPWQREARGFLNQQLWTTYQFDKYLLLNFFFSMWICYMENCVPLFVGVKPKDTTKPKIGGRKGLLSYAANKENIGHPLQNSVSLE